MARKREEKPQVASPRRGKRPAPDDAAATETRRASPKSPQFSKRRHGLILGAILVVALVLRIAYLTEVVGTPEFSAPAVDPGFHDYWARAIATGDWTPPPDQPDPKIRTTPYLRPPGYPYFLALIYRVAGPSYMTPRLVQILLGLMNVLLAYAVARKWYGNTVALVLAGLMSVYWIFIYFEGQLQAPTLLVFLILGSVYLVGVWWEKGAWHYALLAGGVLGLAAVVRPNALSLLAIIVLWMLCVGRRARSRSRKTAAGGGGGTGDHAGGGRTTKNAAGGDCSTKNAAGGGCGTRTMSGVLALIAGSVAVIAPATIRNYVVAGDFVLISANGGVNLYIGNNENADGFYYGNLGELGEFGTCYDYPRIVRQVEIAEGRALSYSEVSRYFARRAIDFIRHHPQQVIRLTAKKAALFWGPHEISHNRVIHYDRAFSQVLRNIPVNFAVVIALFLLGLIRLVVDLRRVRKQPAASLPGLTAGTQTISVLIILLIAAYFVSYLPFFNTARYRVPVIPFLLLFGAYGLSSLGHLVVQRNMRGFALWLLIGLGLYAAARTPLIPYQPDLAEWLFARGAAYRRLGARENAVAAFRESLELDPDNPRTHCNLALALAELGRFDQAVDAWKEALRIQPAHVDAHNDLGTMLLHHGRSDEAVQHFAAAVEQGANYPAPYVNLAHLLAARGELEGALELYQRALWLDPEAPAARIGLGLVLARQGDFDAAVEHLREALRLRPELPEVHVNLGLVLKEAGQTEEAIRHYATALQLRPDDARTHHNLGAALEDLGRVDEAIVQYRTAIRLDPTLTLTRLNLAKALETQGDIEGAIEQLRHVLRLDPSNSEALDKLRALQQLRDRS